MQLKPSFSLIEVIFAIAFLVLVGVAMISLNSAASRITEATELKQVGLALNEQSIAFAALEKRTKTDFATTINNAGCGTSCYVVCPIDTNQLCTFQNARATIQIGTNKLQFSQTVKIQLVTGSPDHYLVNATSSWGKGARQQITTARILE